jgi:hypothetical protein
VSLGNLTEALKGELTATTRNVKPKYGREYVEWCCKPAGSCSATTSPRFRCQKEDSRVTVIENPEKPRPEAYYSKSLRPAQERRLPRGVREVLIRRDITAFNPGCARQD